MIQLAILCTVAQSGISFIDEVKAPKFRNFVMESSKDERPGLFIIKEAKYDSKVQDKAASYLKDFKIEFVVQKESNGSLTAWDLKGNPISLQDGDVPERMISELAIGEPVLKLTQLHPEVTSDHSLTIQGHIFSETRNSVTSMTTWCDLGKPKSPFVNVRLKDEIRFEAGSIEPTVGAKATLDRTPFEVTALEPIAGGSNKRLVINQKRENPQGDYGLEIAVDTDRFKQDNPGNGSALRQAYGSDSAGAGDYRTFRVTCNRPTTYWKTVAVYRTSPVRAYISHVPTAPVGR